MKPLLFIVTIALAAIALGHDQTAQISLQWAQFESLDRFGRVLSEIQFPGLVRISDCDIKLRSGIPESFQAFLSIENDGTGVICDFDVNRQANIFPYSCIVEICALFRCQSLSLPGSHDLKIFLERTIGFSDLRLSPFVDTERASLEVLYNASMYFAEPIVRSYLFEELEGYSGPSSSNVPPGIKSTHQFAII